MTSAGFAYRPIASIGLMAALILVFAAEIAFGIGAWSEMLQPTLTTLAAFGGASRMLIEEGGEWFRVLTLALLHANALHLGMNCLGLWLGGRALEPIVGRCWLLAIFAIGAVSGGVASVFFNPPNIVGVGASGAIMGLFGFLLAFAFRIPDAEARKAYIGNSMGVLIPSLAPALLSSDMFGGGLKIDYASHAGGALGGAAVAGLLALVWRDISRPLDLGRTALAICTAAALVIGYGWVTLYQRYPDHAFVAGFIPNDLMPGTDSELGLRAVELLAKFPNDPRVHFAQAISLARSQDASAAERHARKAFDLVERYPRALKPEFRQRVRGLLALTLVDLKRLPDAREIAAPLCSDVTTEQLKALLARSKLCEKPAR